MVRKRQFDVSVTIIYWENDFISSTTYTALLFKQTDSLISWTTFSFLHQNVDWSLLTIRVTLCVIVFISISSISCSTICSECYLLCIRSVFISLVLFSRSFSHFIPFLLSCRLLKNSLLFYISSRFVLLSTLVLCNNVATFEITRLTLFSLTRYLRGI